MQVFMHVNYLEKVFTTDEIARRAADAGFDGIELPAMRQPIRGYALYSGI